jgi:hypothetical protein
MLLYRDCNFNLLSLSSNKTNNQTKKKNNIGSTAITKMKKHAKT